MKKIIKKKVKVQREGGGTTDKTHLPGIYDLLQTKVKRSKYQILNPRIQKLKKV